MNDWTSVCSHNIVSSVEEPGLGRTQCDSSSFFASPGTLFLLSFGPSSVSVDNKIRSNQNSDLPRLISFSVQEMM